MKGTVVKKIFMLNKNIVHLIDDIFWHMPFKNPTHDETVIMFIIQIILTICIISVIRIMSIIRIISIKHIMLSMRIMLIIHIILIIL